MTDFPFPGLNLAVTTPFDCRRPGGSRPARGASGALHRRRRRRLRPQLRHRHARLSLARGVRRAGREGREDHRRAGEGDRADLGPDGRGRGGAHPPRRRLRAPTASWCCRRSSRDRPTTRACSPSTPPPPRAGCRSSATTSRRPSASASRRRFSASSAGSRTSAPSRTASGDLAQQTDLIRTGRPVMNGADPLMPYALFAGAAGLIWGGANFAPRTCVALVRAAGGAPLGRRARDLAAAGAGDEPDLAGRLRAVGLRRRRDHRLRCRRSRAARCARSPPTSSGPLRAALGELVAPRAEAVQRERRRQVFKTSQLPENPGVCGWVAMLPPRAVTPPLAEAITADVTVIGAGFAGLSAARRLAQIDPTLKVVVLEARRRRRRTRGAELRLHHRPAARGLVRGLRRRLAAEEPRPHRRAAPRSDLRDRAGGRARPGPRRCSTPAAATTSP